jgi:hypothetical protein
LAACLALLLWGCNAPRNNPFDPEAGNYIGLQVFGSIHGRVTSKAGSPLSGALIHSIADDTTGSMIAAISNLQGFYTIENAPQGQYQLVCALDNHLADTLIVQINPGAQTAVNFSLDAHPIIQDYQIISQYFDGLGPPLYLARALQARIVLSDADGYLDIAGMRLVIQGSVDTTFVTMDSVVGSLFFSTVRLWQTVFPGDTIGQNIVGQPCICTVWDNTGGSNQASDSVEHILPFIPEINPIGPVYVQPFAFSWQPHNIFYSFVYNVRVANLNNQVIWQQQSIRSDSLVSDSLSLPQGTYTWTLEVADEFGNTARSAPEQFVVWP